MTAIMENPTTTTTEHPETVTVVADVIDEAAALREYKRKVRAEALKAKAGMDWCVSGTNERLEILGLRKIGQGVPIKVTITATRTAYVKIDADDAEEAKALIEAGDESTYQNISSTLSGGWKVESVGVPDDELTVDCTKTRETGDADDTCSGIAMATDYQVELDQCRRSSSGGYSCTLPVGHEGPQHAAGNGRRIVSVWARRAPRPAADGEPVPVVGQAFADYVDAYSGGRCAAEGGGYYCTRRVGHSGLHAGAYGPDEVGHVWEDEDD